LSAPFEVVVVSPARPVYRGEARFVALSAFDGEIGIAPGHADLVGVVGIGPLRIEKGEGGGGADRFAVRGGFLKVGRGKVTVLVDQAVAPDEVDEAAVRRELEETIAALRHPKSDEEFDQLLDRRAWCHARLALRR